MPMGVLYQLLHQAYKLRWSAPKTNTRLSRLFGITHPHINAGTHISMDFLYPYSTGHESLRDNYVVRLWVLHLLARFFPHFLFFKTKALAPGQIRLRVPFKAFKLRYRAIANRQPNPRLCSPNLCVDRLTPAEHKLLMYLFISKQVVLTYRLVELSAQNKRSVSHCTLLTAIFLDLTGRVLRANWVQGRMVFPQQADQFSLHLVSSQDLGPKSNHRKPALITIAPRSTEWLAARQPGLRALMNAPERPTFDDNTQVDSKQHPTFHRYTLSGQGLDHSLTTPVRGLLNKLYNKGRTPRNKQIYRTGVFWCLWLTILTIVGPFYVFYGFTFMYTHLYIFPLAILARAALVALGRFFNLTAKQLWLRLYNLC